MPPAPEAVPKPRRPRGARPSPRHRLASATPHKIRGNTPSQMIVIPQKLSMWENATYGCCVTSSEAFAKGCSPGVFIEDATVLQWATQYGFLNGADLISVLDQMQVAGFSQGGQTYYDGAPNSVDWTDAATLQNAIAQGPVKIGVASAQLDNVAGIGEMNGWIATGFTPDSNLDHCVSLSGFGPISYLCSALGVPVPAGIDGTQIGYCMFTWSTLGIITWDSLQAITGEAWLRNPTTLLTPGPQPTPTPNPPTPPAPPTPPTPTPPPGQVIVTDVNGLSSLMTLPLSVVDGSAVADAVRKEVGKLLR